MHVFTGRASSTSEALTRAHQVYDAALAARAGRTREPGKQDGDWEHAACASAGSPTGRRRRPALITLNDGLARGVALNRVGAGRG